MVTETKEIINDINVVLSKLRKGFFKNLHKLEYKEKKANTADVIQIL